MLLIFLRFLTKYHLTYKEIIYIELMLVGNDDVKGSSSSSDIRN